MSKSAFEAKLFEFEMNCRLMSEITNVILMIMTDDQYTKEDAAKSLWGILCSIERDAIVLPAFEAVFKEMSSID